MEKENCTPYPERRLELRVTQPASVRTLLARALGLATSVVSRAKMQEDGILLDGLRVFTDVVAQPGQTLSILLSDRADGDLLPVDGPVSLLYEDPDLLVVNKPAGLPVYPAHGHDLHTLGNYMAGYYQKLGIPFVFRAVNRLDRGTSGLMVVARHAHGHECLKNQLHTGDFRRIYLAVCDGVPPQAEATVDAPIGRAGGTILGRTVREDGDRAVTHYRVLSQGGGRSLVELELETGRTHQIRVHMKSLGCPVTGDFLYGTEHPDLPQRVALHAWKIHLTQPLTGGALDLSAPIPPVFSRLLGQM